MSYWNTSLSVRKKPPQGARARGTVPGALCRSSGDWSRMFQMTASGWFQNRWPLKRFGKTTFPESHDLQLPSDCGLSTQQHAANIPETEMLTNNCPLVTQVRHNSPLQILCVSPWGLTLCSYLLFKAPTLWFFCSVLSASLYPHLASEVRKTIIILFGGKFKLKEMRWMQSSSWSSWMWTSLTLSSIFFL